MNAAIRSATLADRKKIEAVTVSALLNAPYTSHTERYISNALRKAAKLSVSLVAEADGTVFGHVAISQVSISDRAPDWFGLGSISVLPQHQRRGVGAKLPHEALHNLRERGARGCVVLGDPKYYCRFGFHAEPSLGLPGFRPKYFQAIAFDSSKTRGTVRCHEAFEAQD